MLPSIDADVPGVPTEVMDQSLLKRFTDASMQVVQLARTEARRQGHNYVSTEQLLLGLLLNETGSASEILKQLGLTVERTRAQIEVYSGQGSGLVAVEPPLTHRAYRMLHRSIAAADQMKIVAVNTHHLLLGLLREADVISIGILETYGIDLVSLEQKLLSLDPQTVDPESVLHRFQTYLSAYIEQLDLGHVYRPLTAIPLATGDCLITDLVCVSHQSASHTLPDVVIEMCSTTKSLHLVKAKMQVWIAAGVQAGVVIDPAYKRVLVYWPDQALELFQETETIRLTHLFTEFEIQGSALWFGQSSAQS